MAFFNNIIKDIVSGAKQGLQKAKDVRNEPANQPVKTPVQFSGNIVADIVNTAKQAYSTPIQAPVAPSHRSLVESIASPTPEQIGTAKEVVESIPQAVPQAGARIALAAQGKESYQPTGKIEQALLGKQPVKSFTGYGQDIQSLIGVSPESKVGGITAPIVGGLLTAFDATPFGMGKSKVLESVIKASTRKEALELLAKTGVTGDRAEAFVTPIVRASDAKTAERVLQEAQASTKAPQVVESRFPKTIQKSEFGSPELKAGVEGITHEVRDTEQAFADAQRYVDETPNLTSESIKEIAKTSPDRASFVGQALIVKLEKLADVAATPVERETFLQRSIDTATQLSQHLTEQGRSIQAASIFSRLSPEAIVKTVVQEVDKFNATTKGTKVTVTPDMVTKARNAAEKLKDTSSVARTVNKEVEDVKKLLDALNKEKEALEKSGDAKRFTAIKKQYDETLRQLDALNKEKEKFDNLSLRAMHNLNNVFGSIIPTEMSDKFIGLWKAGLLTGIKTSGINIASTAAHAASELLKNVPATAIDIVASKVLGTQRTRAITMRGLPVGAKEGFVKGWDYIKTGFDPEKISIKLDYKKLNYGDSKFGKIAQTYVDSVFRILGAEDKVFFEGMHLNSLYNQAKVAAINNGLKGAERAKYIENLVQNPTEQMLFNAIQDAEIATFRNQTKLGDVAKVFQRAGWVGEVVVPFTTTPAAVAMQVLNYSPIGAVKTIVENIGKGKFNQRAFVDGLGRSITGTTPLVIGAYLFKNDLLNIGQPESEKERKQWELEGRKPNSFRVSKDSPWRSVNILGPVGNLLAVGGYFQKGYDDTGSVVSGATQATFGMGKTLVDQTFLKGVAGTASAINDPQRYGDYLIQNMAGSTVPTLIADVAGAIDPTQRDVTSIGGAVAARIPGVRQTVEPKVDVLGQEVARATNPIAYMIDPSRPSEQKSSPLIVELRRLTDAGEIATPTKLGKATGYDSISKERNTELQKRAGILLETKLSKLIQLDAYKELSDENKRKKIEDFVEKSRELARAEIVNQETEGMSGDELKTKLSEMKEDGLLTRGVYDRYKTLR